MQELEKILEEIEQAKREPWYRLNNYDVKHKLDGAINRIVDIIRKHMNEGWIPVGERLPDEYDGLVLAQVSGKPRENITLNNALQLACYISEAGEGWIVEEYPEWENPNVIAWRPLPEPYRPERIDT